MKFLSIFFILCGTSLLFSFHTPAKKPGANCSMAVTYAEMAFKDFKKAYKASSIDEAREPIKSGVKNATESSAYAITPGCNCANAKNYALNAVTFGNYAADAKDLETMKKQAKKAMDASLDVLTATPNCN